MAHVKINMKLIKGDGHPIVARQQDRNSKCRCGSGKKVKNCCGSHTKYFSTKPKSIEV